MYVFSHKVKRHPETLGYGKVLATDIKSWLLTYWRKVNSGSNFPCPANLFASLQLYCESRGRYRRCPECQLPPGQLLPGMMMLTNTALCSVFHCPSYSNSLEFISLAWTNTKGWDWTGHHSGTYGCNILLFSTLSSIPWKPGKSTMWPKSQEENRLDKGTP